MLQHMPPATFEHKGLTPADRPKIEALLKGLDAFTDAERAVALELVDTQLSHLDVDDYRFILAFGDGNTLAGYLCYGRTPMTAATYDLYWVATSPAFARQGVARGLVAAMDHQIKQEGGGTVRVETGTREGHGAAVRFYDATGYSRACAIPDFYAPGDHLLIFTKRISGSKVRTDADLNDPALLDAVFGYRDFAHERDFLLDCASRFGDGQVRRVIAWACGPGRHLAAFADRGIAGVGIDTDAAMLAYAKQTAGPRANIEWIEGDLQQPVTALSADISFVPLSAIHTVGSAAALQAHLEAAAASLRSGGLHIIEATHPSDLSPSGEQRTEWTEMVGELVVDGRFTMDVSQLKDGVLPVSLEISSTLKGVQGHSYRTLRQDSHWFVPTEEEWRSICGASSKFSLEAMLGDFNVDVPSSRDSAWRLILVLRRR